MPSDIERGARCPARLRVVELAVHSPALARTPLQDHRTRTNQMAKTAVTLLLLAVAVGSAAAASEPAAQPANAAAVLASNTQTSDLWGFVQQVQRMERMCAYQWARQGGAYAALLPLVACGPHNPSIRHTSH